MESYNLLHARNEIAHNNQMALQATGTFCFMVLYQNSGLIEDFLSGIKLFESKYEKLCRVLFLENAAPEEVHHYLMDHDPEEYNILILCVLNAIELDKNELFFGQEVEFTLDDKGLTLFTEDIHSFPLSTPEEQKQWEEWLLNNTASHEIEFYEPGMD